jgi:hypothetical protein
VIGQDTLTVRHGFDYAARQKFIAATLTVIFVTTLVSMFVDALALQIVAGIAYLLFLSVAMVDGIRRDFYFLAAAIGLSLAILILRDNPWPIIGRAVLLASFFSTFLLALNILRDAAKTSTAVRRCGNYVIAQPPSRRYAALTFAAHLFAVILNYGVVNLLGTMVKRSNTMEAAGGDLRRFKIREKRMMLAVLRGQCTMVGWSPLSILIAICLALIPGLTWIEVAPVGAVYSFLFLALGWVMDRMEWRPRAATGVVVAPQPRAGSFAQAVLPMAAILMCIIGMVIGANLLLGIPMVSAIMLMLPIFALGWIAVQFRHLGPQRMSAMLMRRVRRIPMREFAGSRSETLILSSAAYIGAALSAVVPEQAVAGLMGQLHLPWLAVAIVLAIAVLVAGQIGVNSLVMLTLIGGALHDMSGAGLPSVLLAIALLGGASLSIGSSPYGTPVVLIAGLTGETPERVGRAWNGRFTIAATVVLCLYLGLLSLWLTP